MSVNQAIQNLQNRLKGKWINYYQEHRELLRKLNVSTSGWQSTEGDETKYWQLPKSDFILGVMLALDSQLKEDLELLSSLTSNNTDLVKTLGLSFDIESELEKLSAAEETYQLTSELDDIREQIKQQNGGEF